MRVEYINNENIGNHMTDFIKNGNNTRATIQEESEVLHFFAAVEFGVLSKNCKNYGICRLNPTGKRIQKVKKKNGCCSTGHSVHITYHSERQLEMVFQKSDLREKCRKKYFGTGYFKVDEDFSTLFELVGCHEKLLMSIVVGKYPVMEKENSYTVKFYS